MTDDKVTPDEEIVTIRPRTWSKEEAHKHNRIAEEIIALFIKNDVRMYETDCIIREVNGILAHTPITAIPSVG